MRRFNQSNRAMKSISLKVVLALFITGILVWTGCKKDDDQPKAVGPSLSNFSVTSTPTGTLSANGDTLKTNVGASLTFKIRASKGNTSEDKYLKQFKVTAELIGGTGSNTVKDTTYTESAKKENVDFTISYTLPANSGTYRFVFTISDYNNKTATKTFFVKAGVPCGIGVSVTSIASDSLTVTVAGSGLTSGTYEFSFDGGTTWTTSTTHSYGTVGTKTILVRSAAN
ncbi:MAG: hypothetical protein RML38_09205, partial [Bacteroidia bacterium]|nr:hypothetical protein [Bacteroidia bacterium]